MPRKTLDSSGVRKRFGKPVRDARPDEAIMMPLLRADILRAKKKRDTYDVNDHENFLVCTIAQCASKISGAEVLVMRKHAYLNLPDNSHVLRYELNSAMTEIVHLNDEGRFDEIPANIMIQFRPPAPQRTLVAMRANARRSKQYKSTRGSGRKQRNVSPDPMRGIWRDGVFAAEG